MWIARTFSWCALFTRSTALLISVINHYVSLHLPILTPSARSFCVKRSKYFVTPTVGMRTIRINFVSQSTMNWEVYSSLLPLAATGSLAGMGLLHFLFFARISSNQTNV